ncbi:MAG: ribonuclease R [Phycisphaeraceae bacterium]
MAERHKRRILNHLSDRRYEPRTVRQLAKDLGIPEPEMDAFQDAVEQLLEEDQIVIGGAGRIVLPPPGREVLGVFRRHERGFGFVIPDELTQHGDLFVPPGKTGDAMTGDRVRCRVRREDKRARGGRSPYTGQIVEIVQRADRRYVGTLFKRGKLHLVEVDGRILHDPVIIRDPHAKNAHVGDKVVIELIDYPEGRDELAEGVITEVLGEAGEPDVETTAIMRAYGLAERFDEDVLAQARRAARSFDDKAVPKDREDLTGQFTVTIDPPDARDFDDAISIRKIDEGDAAWELGVHIADVSHFVQVDTPLDSEAYDRGNSTYLPQRVLPMLPELLSNGVCSLQEGVNRFTKSAFIRYDAQGNVVGQRFSRSVIHSDKRMTYLEAQALIDDDVREARKHTKSEPKYSRQLITALKQMDELARVIRKRRFRDGMITLELPEVELIFDESGRVVDAQPEDDAFTHKLIEMFMVEANEAAARLFDSMDIPMVRRIHPDPDAHDISDLRMFARVAGYNIPARPSRKELQTLLDAVRGKPAQHAVHMAVLRTLSKAEYSPMLIGHFALASEHYTHFTSPIRRYPDFVVHRGLDAYLDAVADVGGTGGRKRKQVARKVSDDPRVPDEQRLTQIGRHCSNTERNSQDAERELRTYMVLELLAEHVGEDYDGTVTGVTGNGVFVQLDRYLVDGFVATSELPGPAGERWKLNEQTGALVAQRSGKSVTLGARFVVRIAKVDLTRRQMELVVLDERPARPGKKKPAKKGGKKKSGKQTPKKRRQPKGARKATQEAQKIKSGRKSTPRRKTGRRRGGEG